MNRTNKLKTMIMSAVSVYIMRVCVNHFISNLFNNIKYLSDDSLASDKNRYVQSVS